MSESGKEQIPKPVKTGTFKSLCMGVTTEPYHGTNLASHSEMEQ
jgi:hypothetical protein